MLARDPWSELQTILDWLEPVEAQERYGQVLEGMGSAGEGVTSPAPHTAQISTDRSWNSSSQPRRAPLI